MIELYLPGVPYALIGKVVVGLLLLLGVLIGAVVTVVLNLVVWRWFWRGVSNLMYRGYSIDDKEERPPVWNVRIAGVALALCRFQFWKVPAAYREAESLTENDTSYKTYLKAVFLSDDDP